MILRSSNQSLKLGTQMKGECPNGILSGNSIIECLFGGIWSNELGNCLEGAPFCPLPGVRNGYPVEYDGNRLLVQCRARFAGADGAASFTSNCDGRYWTPNPTCLPVNCSTPESLYNEATLKNSSNYWRAFDVAQYLIEDSISQNPFRQCSRAGTWNDFNFQKVLRCPGKVIPFGSLRSSNVGESILADCVQGFHPNQQVLCMNDGKYQDFPDLCIEAQYSPELCGDGEIMERAGYPGGYTCNCPLKQQFNGTTCIVPECSKFDLIEKIKDENTSQFVEPDKLYYKYFETVSVYTGAIYEHSETLLYYKTVWKCVKKTWELDNTDLWGNIYKEKDIPKCNGSQSDSWVSLNKAQYLPFEVGTGHCESLQETWDPTYCSPKGSWVGEFFCRRAPENRTEKRKMRNKRMKQKNECLLPGNKLIEATSRSLEIGKFATISCKYSGYTLLGSSEIGCSFLSKRNCLLDASSAITIYEGETLTLYCNYRQSCKNRIYICASEEGNEIVEKREIKVSVIPSFNDSPISSSEAEIFLSLAKLGTLVEFSDSNTKIGLTHYPRTRIEKKAQLVQGSCSKDSIEFHQSFAECLPDGIWNRSRSVSSCKCREGKAEYLGECVERGTKCYSCSNDADCKTIKQCDRGEICYSKLAFYMDTKFVDQGCIKRENCILEESANCCDRDYCNDFRQTEKKPTLTGFGKCLDERRTSLECVEAIEVQKNGFPL
ncbi:unnamed protein product, partial [Mesorhabditis belari]|uniref:Sushi domain-containing protein n=1 Tax=Mesorhabditis belari TaxID=2138241 RepID=A0AAF3FME2_9BILA